MPPSARTSILMSLRWTLRRAKPIQIIAVIMTAAPKSLCSNDSAEEYRRLLNTPRLKTLIKFSRLPRKFYGIAYPFGAPVFGQRRIVFALSFVGAEARRGDRIPGILRKLHLIARQDADSVEQSALGGDYYFDIFSLALHKRGLVIPADIDGASILP